jgi:CDP-paratose 2-epimerase
MRILLTGACGFVGSTLARTWVERGGPHTIVGLDNLARNGSEENRLSLRRLGVTLFHGDIRLPSDLEGLPDVDWVVEAAANPSVLAGTDGRASSRQLVEHNLIGTLNVLEFCRARRAGFILLSTSRVYSIAALASLDVTVRDEAFQPVVTPNVSGLSTAGIDETFSTEPPLSLYGATKLASEQLALEYGETFGFEVWVNRCGVLAGAGQFGRGDQGIFSYWIHRWARRAPLAYIGFGGLGHQVRDCLHPRDLVPLLDRQMSAAPRGRRRVQNISGGAAGAWSLRQLSEWCATRFGPHAVSPQAEPRRFDIPWLVLDSARARYQWGWTPESSRQSIVEEIARHAEARPDWLDRCE